MTIRDERKSRRSISYALRGLCLLIFPSTVPLMISSCVSNDASTDCVRRFSDESIIEIVETTLNHGYQYEYSVSWRKCTYNVLIHPVPATPDHYGFIRLDENGSIIYRR